jgi:hypothetical protein
VLYRVVRRSVKLTTDGIPELIMLSSRPACTQASSGLSGLSFDEGTFGVVGYVTRGMNVASSLRSGDVVVSARIISGQDKLLLPPEPVA